MAKYDLLEVKKIADECICGRKGAIYFSARTRSINSVSATLSCTFDEAKEFIIRGFIRLQPNDFSESVLLWGNVVDVYGLQCYLGHNWYVKFAIVEEGYGRIIDQISFHPVEKDLHLLDGRVLKPLFDDDEDNKDQGGV